MVELELGGGEGVAGRWRERGGVVAWGGEGAGAEARWGVGKLWEGGFLGGDASEEPVVGFISYCKGRTLRGVGGIYWWTHFNFLTLSLSFSVCLREELGLEWGVSVLELRTTMYWSKLTPLGHCLNADRSKALSVWTKHVELILDLVDWHSLSIHSWDVVGFQGLNYEVHTFRLLCQNFTWRPTLVQFLNRV